MKLRKIVGCDGEITETGDVIETPPIGSKIGITDIRRGESPAIGCCYKDIHNEDLYWIYDDSDDGALVKINPNFKVRIYEFLKTDATIDTDEMDGLGVEYKVRLPHLTDIPGTWNDEIGDQVLADDTIDNEQFWDDFNNGNLPDTGADLWGIMVSNKPVLTGVTLDLEDEAIDIIKDDVAKTLDLWVNQNKQKESEVEK